MFDFQCFIKKNKKIIYNFKKKINKTQPSQKIIRV